MAKRAKQHSKANPGQARKRAQVRVERKKRAIGSHTEWDVLKVRRKLGDKCAYCGVELFGKGEVEHMTPLAKGGSDRADNIVLACKGCNSEKHAKTVREYYEWRIRNRMSTERIVWLMDLVERGV